MSKEFCLSNDLLEIVENLGGDAKLFEGKNILITGGRGFLGRYFMSVFNYLNENLFTHPANIYIIDNFITSGKLGENLHQYENITYINHDVIKPLDKEIDCKLDFVIHAAGIASPFYYRAHPMETLDVATTGTKNMLELALKNNARFTFFSSSEIYGDPDPHYIPTPENYRGNVSITGPRSCYDISKRLGETLCYIYHTNFGLHTNVIRPFNIFGPGMQANDYRVLPNFASNIQKNQRLKIYGTGNQTRTFCYITDAIVGFLLVFSKGVYGEPYNIGNPVPEISMLDLLSKMNVVLSKDFNYDIIDHPDSYPADEPQRRCPDITKAQLQLNYNPKVSLDDGLSRFFDWAFINY
jgi:UDP-glucuronate decarboxylase